MSSLTQSVQFLQGAGPRRAEALGRLGISTLQDLLLHFPRDYVDRSQLSLVRDLREGRRATALVEVKSVSVQPTRRGLQNFHALVHDETGAIEVVWFNQPYLKNFVKRGARLMLSGEIGRFGNVQFKNPEYELITDEEHDLLHTGRIVPMYPLTAGVSQRMMRSLVRLALDRCREEIEEHLPAPILEERSLAPLAEALQEIHFPASWSGKDRARRRIVYDEFFLYQLLVVRRRTVSGRLPGIAFAARGELSRRVARSLPFDLTGAQKRALVQIRDDMRKLHPMNRLLMGEVGSGKTLVAALASCLAIEDGYQAAFLAPTEILAEQHFASLRRFLPEELVNVHLLTGRMTPRARRPVLDAAAAGDPAIVVGTHALFQEGVEFGKLGFVVVDEQHRFGVQQRAELLAKGPHPDVLVMSATPIPRTLAMMFHGDLDISTLDELPKGRGKVTTRVTDESARESVYRFIRSEIDQGHRAYVVYPIITESEKVDLRAATEMADQLRVHPTFRGRTIGLLHGKMKGEEKSAVMLDFREGRCHLLVTTTVVEVGVDVPEATVMVVEHPERYGLSQLHQLRGRIGRGAARSVFVLMAGPDIGSETLRRLRILESTTSGFRVAEEDLKIRGPGEVFGTRQHGMPELRLASLREDRELLDAAHRDALALFERDPELAGPETAGLRRRLVAEFGDRMGFYHVA